MNKAKTGVGILTVMAIGIIASVSWHDQTTDNADSPTERIEIVIVEPCNLAHLGFSWEANNTCTGYYHDAERAAATFMALTDEGGKSGLFRRAEHGGIILHRDMTANNFSMLVWPKGGGPADRQGPTAELAGTLREAYTTLNIVTANIDARQWPADDSFTTILETTDEAWFQNSSRVHSRRKYKDARIAWQTLWQQAMQRERGTWRITQRFATTIIAKRTNDRRPTWGVAIVPKDEAPVAEAMWETTSPAELKTALCSILHEVDADPAEICDR